VRDLLAGLTAAGFAEAELVAFTGVATSQRTLGATFRAHKAGR